MVKLLIVALTENRLWNGDLQITGRITVTLRQFLVGLAKKKSNVSILEASSLTEKIILQ